MKWVPAARNFSVRQNFLPSNETSFLRTENQSGAEQFCLARNASVTFDLHLVHSLSRQMSDLSLCLGDVAFAIARAPSSRRTGPRYRLAQSSWLELCSDQASYEIPAERSSFFRKVVILQSSPNRTDGVRLLYDPEPSVLRVPNDEESKSKLRDVST